MEETHSCPRKETGREKEGPSLIVQLLRGGTEAQVSRMNKAEMGIKTLTRRSDNNLLVLDVGKNFTIEDPRLFKQIRKTDPNVPRALNEHALWYSKTLNKIYQLGGYASSIGDRGRDPAPLPEVPSAGIWEFDIVSERWTKADDGFDKRNTGDKIERQGSASYCDAPSLGVSFSFEGYVQQRSDKDYASYAPSTDVKCWCSSLCFC